MFLWAKRVRPRANAAYTRLEAGLPGWDVAPPRTGLAWEKLSDWREGGRGSNTAEHKFALALAKAEEKLPWLEDVLRARDDRIQAAHEANPGKRGDKDLTVKAAMRTVQNVSGIDKSSLEAIERMNQVENEDEETKHARMDELLMQLEGKDSVMNRRALKGMGRDIVKEKAMRRIGMQVTKTLAAADVDAKELFHLHAGIKDEIFGVARMVCWGLDTDKISNWYVYPVCIAVFVMYVMCYFWIVSAYNAMVDCENNLVDFVDDLNATGIGYTEGMASQRATGLWAYMKTHALTCAGDPTACNFELGWTGTGVKGYVVARIGSYALALAPVVYIAFMKYSLITRSVNAMVGTLDASMAKNSIVEYDRAKMSHIVAALGKSAKSLKNMDKDEHWWYLSVIVFFTHFVFGIWMAVWDGSLAAQLQHLGTSGPCFELNQNMKQVSPGALSLVALPVVLLCFNVLYTLWGILFLIQSCMLGKQKRDGKAARGRLGLSGEAAGLEGELGAREEMIDSERRAWEATTAGGGARDAAIGGEISRMRQQLRGMKREGHNYEVLEAKLQAEEHRAGVAWLGARLPRPREAPPPPRRPMLGRTARVVAGGRRGDDDEEEEEDEERYSSPRGGVPRRAHDLFGAAGGVGGGGVARGGRGGRDHDLFGSTGGGGAGKGARKGAGRGSHDMFGGGAGGGEAHADHDHDVFGVGGKPGMGGLSRAMQGTAAPSSSRRVYEGKA